MTAARPARRTVLDALHRSLGATMTDFAGWEMPLRYGSERAEHQAVRTRAGLFDLSHMGEITVSGPAAAELLDYALVGEVSSLAQDRARYTVLCDERGGILDDLIIYRLAEQEFLVVANAANTATVLQALHDRRGALPSAALPSSAADAAAGAGLAAAAGVGAGSGADADSGVGPGADSGPVVDVRDDGDAYALLAVQGPLAVTILSGLTDPDPDGLRYYSAAPGIVGGVPALIARTGYTGEDGFELFVAPSDAPVLWEALTTAGGPGGLVPCGLASRDTLRLEAGMPLYGHELTTATTPFDAGLGRLVKFDKQTNGGRFVGREALAAIARRPATDPPRALVGLVSEGRRVPRAGYPVVHTASGAVIGEVTSGAPSPTLGRPIAMAYLDAAHAARGAEGVAVDIRGTYEPYEVVALPFYRRTR